MMNANIFTNLENYFKSIIFVLLFWMLYELANDVTYFLENHDMVSVTRNIGNFLLVSSLMAGGVFFKGASNRQAALWFSGIIVCFGFVYYPIGFALQGLPYLGAWVDTACGLLFLCILTFRLQIENYIAYKLGSIGIMPQKMMRVLKNNRTTNFHLMLITIYTVTVVIDFIILTLISTGYGLFNNIPFQGSFYNHMIENGNYIFLDGLKLTVFDIRDIFQDVITITTACLTIGHIAKDFKEPDAIGFYGDFVRSDD
jgi:hypothetical protein